MNLSSEDASEPSAFNPAEIDALIEQAGPQPADFEPQEIDELIQADAEARARRQAPEPIQQQPQQQQQAKAEPTKPPRPFGVGLNINRHEIGGIPPLKVNVTVDGPFETWLAAQRQKNEQELAVLRFQLREFNSLAREELKQAHEIRDVDDDQIANMVVTQGVADYARLAARSFECEARLRTLGVVPGHSLSDAWDWFLAEVVEPQTELEDEDGQE